MKKIMAILMVGVIAASLFGCSKDAGEYFLRGMQWDMSSEQVMSKEKAEFIEVLSSPDSLFYENVPHYKLENARLTYNFSGDKLKHLMYVVERIADGEAETLYNEMKEAMYPVWGEDPLYNTDQFTQWNSEDVIATILKIRSDSGYAITVMYAKQEAAPVVEDVPEEEIEMIDTDFDIETETEQDFVAEDNTDDSDDVETEE